MKTKEDITQFVKELNTLFQKHDIDLIVENKVLIAHKFYRESSIFEEEEEYYLDLQ